VAGGEAGEQWALLSADRWLNGCWRSFELLEQDGGKLVGYAAVYAPATSEDLGGFKERIHPGAFDASLEKNADIRALWDHNTSQPLARTTNGTLKLASDKRGLRVEIELPDGVSYANDLRQLVRSGVVNQMSFGFMVPPGGDTWEKDEEGNAVRTLHSIDLHEVSVVSIPAYPDTTVALRGLRQMDFEQRRARWLASHGHRAAKVLGLKSQEANMSKIDEIKKLTEERAGLVDQERVYLFHAFERLGILDQHTHAGSPTDPDHDRHRRGKSKRTWAGDDQHRDRGNESVNEPRLRPPDRPACKGGKGNGETCATGSRRGGPSVRRRNARRRPR